MSVTVLDLLYLVSWLKLISVTVSYPDQTEAEQSITVVGTW